MRAPNNPKAKGSIMQPPVIDQRDLDALIKQMTKLYPYYTPEWRFSPEDPDPGTALFLIFAGMFQENIKRFNQVAAKNFMAFVNMFNFPVLPAKPARAYVTFKLSEGAEKPVLIPAGTQVSADVPEGDEPVVFETDGSILATPAYPVAAYNVSSKLDYICKIPDECLGDPGKKDKPPFALLDFPHALNLQEHSLYLGHGDLFNIKDTAVVELEFRNSLKRFKEPSICAKLVDLEYTDWAYIGENGWQAFDEVSADGNKVILKKTKRLQIKQASVGGSSSRWIRCRAKAGKVAGICDIEIDGVGAGVAFYDVENRKGIEPDMVFYNDVQQDLTGFYPFGQYFVQYDAFYLSSQEVFSKKGADVSLRFNLKHVANSLTDSAAEPTDWKLVMKQEEMEVPLKTAEVAVTAVAWEYWNGNGWVRLSFDKKHEEIFYRQSDQEQSIVFKCPADLEETFVNEQYNYWIRARITSIQNNYAANSVYRSPWIEGIVLKYEFVNNKKHPIEHCLTYNNVEYRDMTEEAINAGNIFFPFQSLACRHPSFYLGFALPPLKGPVSMFFSIKDQKYAGEDLPFIEWEYLRSNGSAAETAEWAVLKTVDETRGFTRSGTVVFAGPSDFVRSSVFGQELFWIRAVNRDGKFELEQKPAAPIVKGIYMNSTRVTQQVSIKNEAPELAGEINKVCQLAALPVISGEVWVNEARYLTEAEKKLFVDNELFSVSEIKDGEGRTNEFWIKWHPVDDFLDSGPEDRHYVIDRSLGKIYFGDGKNGKIPPLSDVKNIKVKYSIGGGTKGNVGPFEIKNLQNSIAFVDEVFNPEPAGGGCDMETVANALRRGPQILKHRNRAVTAEDFEWLVRQASQNIARVKCLPNINLQMKKETGCVAIVILPKGGNAGLAVFPELRQQVERYVMDRTSGTLSFPGKIQVIKPAFLEISVYAVLVVKEVENVAPVEKEAVDRLNEYLDPLTGGNTGNGWEIGQSPHISIFYALLKSISNVNHVEKVSMTVYKIEDNLRTEMDSNNLANLLHGMVTNGSHSVDVKVL